MKESKNLKYWMLWAIHTMWWGDLSESNEIVRVQYGGDAKKAWNDAVCGKITPKWLDGGHKPLDEAYCEFQYLKNAEKSGIRFLVPDMEEWPTKLGILKDKEPLFLWYRGNAELLKSPTKLAIVGSRNVSKEALLLTKKAAEVMDKNRVTVMSGGAVGIDAAGMSMGGIGVYPHGIEKYYPPSDKPTFDRFANEENCLALSEYPPGEQPQRSYFIARNRIIVALSSAVYFTQAKERSGTQNAVNTALSLGIPVYTPNVLGNDLGYKLVHQRKVGLASEPERVVGLIQDQKKNTHVQLSMNFV